MDTLIGDLLDAGRIDTGTLSVAPEFVGSRRAGGTRRAATFLSGGGAAHRAHRSAARPAPGNGRSAIAWCRCSTTCSPTRSATLRNPPPSEFWPSATGLHVAVSVSDEGQGIAPETSRQAVHQVHGRPGPGGWRRRWRPRRARARDLQGPGRGPWRAHPGRERRRRPRHALHVHDPGGRGGRRRGSRRSGPLVRGDESVGGGAHPGGRRRPGDAAPCPRHAGGGGLRPAGDRRPPGSRAHRAGREAAAGPARPDAARDGRRRADDDRAGARPACRSSSSRATGATRPSRGRSRRAPTTTSSSRSRRPSSRPGSGRPLRRRSHPAPFKLGELSIDFDRRRASVAGRPVTLTATEFRAAAGARAERGPGSHLRGPAARGLGRTQE